MARGGFLDRSTIAFLGLSGRAEAAAMVIVITMAMPIIVASVTIMTVPVIIGVDGGTRRCAHASANDGAVSAANLLPHRTTDRTAHSTADGGIQSLVAGEGKAGRQGQRENRKTSTHLHVFAPAAKPGWRAFNSDQNPPATQSGPRRGEGCFTI